MNSPVKAIIVKGSVFKAQASANDPINIAKQQRYKVFFLKLLDDIAMFSFLRPIRK